MVELVEDERQVLATGQVAVRADLAQPPGKIGSPGPTLSLTGAR